MLFIKNLRTVRRKLLKYFRKYLPSSNSTLLLFILLFPPVVCCFHWHCLKLDLGRWLKKLSLAGILWKHNQILKSFGEFKLHKHNFIVNCWAVKHMRMKAEMDEGGGKLEQRFVHEKFLITSRQWKSACIKQIARLEIFRALSLNSECCSDELKVCWCIVVLAFERLNDIGRTLRQDQRHFVCTQCLRVDWKATTKWNLDERCLIASINSQVILNALESKTRSVIDTFYAQQFPLMLAGVSLPSLTSSDSKSKCWFETFSGWRAASGKKMNQFNRFFLWRRKRRRENIWWKVFQSIFLFLLADNDESEQKFHEDNARSLCRGKRRNHFKNLWKTFAFRVEFFNLIAKLCLKLE